MGVGSGATTGMCPDGLFKGIEGSLGRLHAPRLFLEKVSFERSTLAKKLCILCGEGSLGWPVWPRRQFDCTQADSARKCVG